MRRFGSRRSGVRHGHRGHGCAHLSNTQATAAHDVLWFGTAHPRGGLYEAAAGMYYRGQHSCRLIFFLCTVLHAFVSASPRRTSRLGGGDAKRTVVTTTASCVQGLDLSHDKFIDLCILCGCDYTGSIKGIGPKKALALVRQVRDQLC